VLLCLDLGAVGTVACEAEESAFDDGTRTALFETTLDFKTACEKHNTGICAMMHTYKTLLTVILLLVMQL